MVLGGFRSFHVLVLTGSTTITEVEPFKETLATPTDIPESFLISKSTAEILGIAQFSVYHSCQVCKKKLHDENTNIRVLLIRR